MKSVFKPYPWFDFPAKPNLNIAFIYLYAISVEHIKWDPNKLNFIEKIFLLKREESIAPQEVSF